MSYINREYWDQFYKNTKGLSDASTFSEYILTRIKNQQSQIIVVDLGCGTGKDSFNFVKNGFETIGVDGSEEVTKINKSKVKTMSVANIDFYCIDLSDRVKVTTLMKSFNESAKVSRKKILFYTRFFLHAIPEQVEDILLENIHVNIDVPFLLASEFRTKEDADLDKIYDNHYRRYIDTDELLRKVLNLGFSVQSFTKGRGLSVYKNEDPYLARVIVEKQ
ncbi:methyltransferase domain-containing protein [Metasolibacillus fluoroglycofenilyticus]|uniref:methyltransferase domain-containing protein n=1 Tax=Metasolibacillus fluoroglycofenilyticus TaxID=1239396 RepID=UPI000D3955AD|nr:class I SAM-dependent methyltransferase [Metasolibacillus fluoroglycofenilyticus]